MTLLAYVAGIVLCLTAVALAVAQGDGGGALGFLAAVGMGLCGLPDVWQASVERAHEELGND
jgi:hypothetical protein